MEASNGNTHGFMLKRKKKKKENWKEYRKWRFGNKQSERESCVVEEK